MDYKMFFETPEGKRIEIKTEASECGGKTVFSGSGAGLEWRAVVREEGCVEFRVINAGREPVTGRAIIEFGWQDPEQGYTLIPGVYYNGNYREFLKIATYLKMPEHPRFAISLAACATPCMISWDGGSKGRYISMSPTSAAGWNGAELDGEKRTFSFCLPAGRDDYMGKKLFERCPLYTWYEKDVVSGRFTVREFECRKPEDVFDYLFKAGRKVYESPAHNEFRADPAETVSKVLGFLVRKHYYETEKGIPVIKNATTDFGPDVLPEDFKEWNIMIGWCSGTMTALPMLAAGGRARVCALRYVDYITTEGFSPSGIKMPIFDGYEWIDPRPEYCQAKGEQYEHARFYCDYLYYLGRAIRYEKSIGNSHPAWENDFRKEICLVMDLWEREHDFGLYWNIMDEKLTVKRKGSAAGAFALQALTEAWKHGIERPRIEKILKEADATYYERCVVSGRCTGGPNDIKEADDSESIAALTDAFVMQYDVFGDRKLLEMALAAGKMFASWCVSYCPPFPGGSALFGLNVCGGVIANAQNRHIGPGICTNSGFFVKRLGEITGDSAWTNLYGQIRCTAYNCVCMYDGEFFNEDISEEFREGMVTEQINVYDLYSKPGYAWCVSASWPATNILLNDFDEKYGCK